MVRAKGQLWVASANAYPVDFHAAGRHIQLVPAPRPYLAAVARREWEPGDREQCEAMTAAGTWHPTYGDRESEAVLIGVGLDRPRILQELGAALLTDAEVALGATGWKAFEDVFFSGKFFEVRAEEDFQNSVAEATNGYSLKVAKKQ